MSAARTIRAVSPHVPKIKFPFRSKDSSNSVKNIFPAVASSQATPSKPTPSSSKPIGITPRGSGIDFTELPPRYHRLELTEEEIEYITRGGPA